MMEYVLEIWKKSWKCTVKKLNLDFPKHFINIFSQTNVFIGFYSKSG
jgi:hypothetical protein